MRLILEVLRYFRLLADLGSNHYHCLYSEGPKIDIFPIPRYPATFNPWIMTPKLWNQNILSFLLKKSPQFIAWNVNVWRAHNTNTHKTTYVYDCVTNTHMLIGVYTQRYICVHRKHKWDLETSWHPYYVNSSAPARCKWNFRWGICKPILYS